MRARSLSSNGSIEAPTIVTQGNHSKQWRAYAPDADGCPIPLDANWTCRVVVGSIDRAVTATEDNRFLVQLSDTETDTLTPGEYTLAIEISNPTLTPVPYKRETKIQIIVVAATA